MEGIQETGEKLVAGFDFVIFEVLNKIQEPKRQMFKDFWRPVLCLNEYKKASLLRILINLKKLNYLFEDHSLYHFHTNLKEKSWLMKIKAA